MPQRSFLGVGVLIGLIAGAWFGLQTGHLAFRSEEHTSELQSH